jgi:hypothetical protein
MPAGIARGGFVHETPGRSVEWYTPPEIFAALGLAFDLDPAAPPGGVPWVPARRSLSVIEDGLQQPWTGTVWLNPPYGRGVGRWLERLSAHGDGLALVYARTDTVWFQTAVPRASLLCFIRRRLSFIGPDGQRAGAGPGTPVGAHRIRHALRARRGGLGSRVAVPGHPMSSPRGSQPERPVVLSSPKAHQTAGQVQPL